MAGLGTALPIGLLIDRQIGPRLAGLRIEEAVYERCFEGKQAWHDESCPALAGAVGGVVCHADASNILTEDGVLLHFTYFDGDLRYFAAGEPIAARRAPIRSNTHGYHITLALSGGARVRILIYSWGTLFAVSRVDMRAADPCATGRCARYPMIARGPIDLGDAAHFTLARFERWLATHPNENIIENCSTAHGAFDLSNAVMSYLLLISGIHPRTKTRDLTAAEIEALYRHTADLMEDYRAGARVCEHSDIFGRRVAASNDIPWMTSKMLGAPCPVCATPIKAVPMAGTKMYFCPHCQRQKN